MSDNPGFELTTAVIAAADSMLRASQALFRPHGLSAAQFNVLNLIAQGRSGMSQREISEKLVVDRSNVTGLLDRMEKAGWVRRNDDPLDRRVYRVVLTPAGQALWNRTSPLYRNAIANVTKGFSNKELKECSKLLERLLKAAEGWKAE